jgi:hypothetical protein
MRLGADISQNQSVTEIFARRLSGFESSERTRSRIPINKGLCLFQYVQSSFHDSYNLLVGWPSQNLTPGIMMSEPTELMLGTTEEEGRVHTCTRRKSWSSRDEAGATVDGFRGKRKQRFKLLESVDQLPTNVSLLGK